MPFKSEKQRKACWATNGFHGAIDCHEWAHAKKEMGGSNMKYRGHKGCKECGGVLQDGGTPPCHDMIGNEIPCPGKEMRNASNNHQWTETTTLAEQREQELNRMKLPQADKNYLIHNQQGSPNPFKVVNPDAKQPDKIDPLFALMGASTGLSWLSGIVERKRQNKEMQDQFYQMNQMNAMPADDYQPNPYSLYSRYGGAIQKYAGGGSIVDYLASKGQKNSFEDRRGIFAKQFGNEHYTGTAEQNLRLLSTLRGEKPTPTPTPIKDTPSTNYSGSLRGANIGSSLPRQSIQRAQPTPTVTPAAPSQGKLQSGTVVDKRTGKQYIIQNGKITKEFNVLTGKNPEGNRNDYSMAVSDADPRTRATPVGSYFMNPQDDVYGMPGFQYQPIQAFGQAAPLAKGIYEHITYPGEKAKREPLYGSTTPWASQGCVNTQGQSIKCLTQTFPKGDTVTVVDSKTREGMSMLNQYRPKKYGGELKSGGKWIQGAVKHPGRCTPGSPNYDCPKGSPQYNLAQTFKKHHGFHRGKK